MIAAATEKRKAFLEREIRRMLPELVKLGVERVILFGSAARGDIHARSDLDIAVIWDTPLRYMDRLDRLYEAAAPAVATDFFAYTPAEWEGMQEASPFARRIAWEGVVLYAKGAP